MEEQTQDQFVVVINGEEQYALWPAVREAPAGWSLVGFEGSEGACMAWIDTVWTDMRPASLRRST